MGLQGMFQGWFVHLPLKISLFNVDNVLQRMASSGMLRRVALVGIDVRRLLITASVVPSSPILVTLMKETLSSTRHISEDAAVKTSDLTMFCKPDRGSALFSALITKLWSSCLLSSPRDSNV
jgi:hypothetical protein